MTQDTIDLHDVVIPRNVMATLEYDGGRFCGWERQKNGLGIQEVVESAIESITREKTTVNGSGRTDAGVHATGQVANFTLQNPIAMDELHRGLNAMLPDDVSVKSIREVPLYFHARFSARSKHYRYTVLNSRIRTPLQRHICHQVRGPLDLNRMKNAAVHLVGRHDFTSFCREPELVSSCVREIQSLQVTADDTFFYFDVHGDGFLYNMVRIVVGTLLQVGLGRIEGDSLPIILDAKKRSHAGPTAPACGLSLVGVSYGEAQVSQNETGR